MEKSFRSFISSDGSSPDANASTASAEYPQKYLPDECKSSACDSCRCCWQLEQPFLATLICTNFRLCIVPMNSMHEKDNEVSQRFLCFDERVEVPLCSIYFLKYAIYPNGKIVQKEEKITEKGLKEYKELKSPLSSMQIISSLKLFLKDMRVLCIDLSKSQHSQGFANHILHFARPAKIEHVLQLRATEAEEERGSARRGQQPSVMYNEEESWRRELRRCLPQEQLMHWRLFRMAKLKEKRFRSSYPGHIVICAGISDLDIEEAVSSFNEGRFPVWCFALGAFQLLRSSAPSTSDLSLLNRIVERVGGAHPNRDAPAIVRVDIERAAVQESFQRLHKICAVDNMARAARYSRSWFSRVAATNWLHLVHAALCCTENVVHRMADKQLSVWLQDPTGRDGTALISSLVQICLDKHARRFTGLENLIAKEWTGLSHPFASHVLGVGQAPFTPFFLLFLDCVHQLILLYPVQFEYSTSCLVALWDLALSGLCPGLATDCPDDQVLLKATSRPFPLGRYFHGNYVAMTHSVPYHAAFALRQSGGGMKPLHCDIIRPPSNMSNLQLWDECYLRWQPDTVIEGGGRMAADCALDRKMEAMSKEGKLQYTPILSHMHQEQESTGTTPPSTPMGSRSVFNRSYV